MTRLWKRSQAAGRPRADRRRRAAAVVEFAVVLPLLITILLGIIEYSWLFMARQTLQQAAREGCRLAVLKTTTEPYQDVIDIVNQMVEPMGLTPTIEMTHATLEDPIETVVVKVPASEVTLVGDFFGSRDWDLGGRCSMRKEGMDEGGGGS